MLKSVEEIGENLKIILRLDTDLPIENGIILDNSRLRKSIPTIRFLLERDNKLVIIGHRGRPNGRDENLSLRPVYLELMELLEGNNPGSIENIFIEDIKDEEKINSALEENQIIFIENIRFWEEEDKGNMELFTSLVKSCHALVNDAIAVAHREAASIILHREMETYYGFNFMEEVEGMKKAVNGEKPMTLILGGAKEDKLKYLDDLLKVADHILIGGKLPKLVDRSSILDLPDGKAGRNNKILIAKLREDGLDLSDEDIDQFIELINSSNTIIWSGAMGFYEDPNCQKGTQKIAMAVAESSASFKTIAGGDTSASIKDLGLKDKINFVCSGGGVLLEMLVKGDLPAWN